MAAIEPEFTEGVGHMRSVSGDNPSECDPTNDEDEGLLSLSSTWKTRQNQRAGHSRFLHFQLLYKNEFDCR